MKINIRKARERFSEIVNLVSIKGERIVLTSKNKPKAAIVSLKDLEVLEDRTIRKAKRLNQLERIKTIRKRLSLKGVISDSVLTLKRIREERIGEL
jgi:prevent-host-death family protein